MTLTSFLSSIGRHRWIWPSALLALLTGAALFAPWIAPQDPYDLASLRLEDSYLPPPWSDEAAQAQDGSLSDHFFLGTDAQGRGIYSAVLYGLRVSLIVGISGTLIALVIGVTLGLLSGYFRGWLDAVVMRAADIQLSFPSVLIALFLMAIWKGDEATAVRSTFRELGKIIFAVGIVHWVIYARMTRGIVLAEREKDYISAIRALGARAPRILTFHLLPNLATPILVVSAVQFASIVMLEATLSYLGLGVPITRPSLGMLIKFGYDQFFSGDWWVWFFPGMALVILIVAINWLADALRAHYSFGG